MTTLDELKKFLDDQGVEGKYRDSKHIQEQFESAFDKGNEIGVVFYTKFGTNKKMVNERESDWTPINFSIWSYYVDKNGNERTKEEFQTERGILPK